MFKTDDGRLFTTLNEAALHEQQTFISAGMTPLLTTLLRKFKPTEHRDQRFLSDEDVDLVVAEAVTCLAEDRPLIQEFQKLFAKLQLHPAQPVSAKRKRAPKKKKPAHHPAAPPIDPAAPAGDTRVTEETKPPWPAQDQAPSGEQAPPPPSP